MKAKSDTALKVVAIVSYVTIGLSITAASSSVATGYELSIYTGTPTLVWPLLVIGVMGGIWLVSDQVVGSARRTHWGVIVGPLVLANLTVLLLPTLRGYFLYASHDSLAHMGMSLDVTLTGHADAENIYPALHVLVAQLSQVCGINPTSVGRFLPVFLNTVFGIVLMYLVGKATLPERGQRLLVVALASGFLLNSLHVMLYTQVLSFFLVLMALYLRLDESVNQRLAGKTLLIVTLLLIPYGHPAPALMIVFFLLAIELADALCRRTSGNPSIGPVSIRLPLISAITFFTWISSFVLFDVKMGMLWDNLRSPFATPHVQTLENALGEVDTGGVVGILLRMYGDSILCMLLATLGTLMVVRDLASGEKGLRGSRAMTAVFAVSVPAQLLIFAGARSQTVGRLVNLNFAIFLSPVLGAYALHRMLRRVGRATAMTVSGAVLLTVWVIGAIGIYHSPWILQPSWQITSMDMRGTEWFLLNTDPGQPFSAMGYPNGVQYAVQGHRAAFSRDNLMESIMRMIYHIDQVLPSGFGYDCSTTLGESTNQGGYLMIASRFQIATTDPTLSSQGLSIAPLFWPGFQPADFAKLEQDPSVDKLYSNGEWEAWRVNVRTHAR